jgi:surfeit locus 1 family protein
MRIRYRFTWIPFIAMVVVVTIGIALGQWQTGRANSKLALQHDMDVRGKEAALMLDATMTVAGDMVFRPVTATGKFVGTWTTYLENRPYKGQAGFYVISPLQLDGTDTAVLVLRGWIPRDMADRTRIADYVTSQESVSITGVIKADAGQVLQLGQAPAPTPGAIMQNLVIADYAQASGLVLLPYVLAQTGEQKDGLVRDWPVPVTGVDKHRGYAVQWYALSLTAFIFFIVTGFRRGKK